MNICAQNVNESWMEREDALLKTGAKAILIIPLQRAWVSGICALGLGIYGKWDLTSLRLGYLAEGYSKVNTGGSP